MKWGYRSKERRQLRKAKRFEKSTYWSPVFIIVPRKMGDTGLWVSCEWVWRKLITSSGFEVWDYRERISPYWSHRKEGFIVEADPLAHLEVKRKGKK